MKNRIIFVLDNTGSMMSYKEETISGFNEYMEHIKQEIPKAFFTLVKFNSLGIEFENSKLVKKTEFLTSETYNPTGATPLLDTLGEVITKYSDKKGKILVSILTDGEENSSTEYKRADIVNLIKEKEAKGWTFTYLGANQDAFQEAGQIGIAVVNTSNYTQDATVKAMNVTARGTVQLFASDNPTAFYDGQETITKEK